MICVIYGIPFHKCVIFSRSMNQRSVAPLVLSKVRKRRSTCVALCIIMGNTNYWFNTCVLRILKNSCNYLIDRLFMKVYDFALDEDDMTKFDGLNRDLRVYAEPMWVLMHFLTLKIIKDRSKIQYIAERQICIIPISNQFGFYDLAIKRYSLDAYIVLWKSVTSLLFGSVHQCSLLSENYIAVSYVHIIIDETTPEKYDEYKIQALWTIWTSTWYVVMIIIIRSRSTRCFINYELVAKLTWPSKS